MSERDFAWRIEHSSIEHSSVVVLALDVWEVPTLRLLHTAQELLAQVAPFVCAVKLNYHLLLPLDMGSIGRLIKQAHESNVQTIADLKLNDIASTNLVATHSLWSIGFDAVIANPFVGFEGGLGPVLADAHERNRGVLLLVHMSHPGAVEGYGLVLGRPRKALYQLFLQRALDWRADGVVIGATNLQVVSEAARFLEGKVPIFAPGAGAQGGDAAAAVRAGANFVIVGRAIVSSPDPAAAAQGIRLVTWGERMRRERRGTSAPRSR